MTRPNLRLKRRRAGQLIRVRDFDPELRLYARLLRPVGMNASRLRMMRRFEALVEPRMPTPREVEIVRLNEDVSLRVYRPAKPSGAAVLWSHGGGYIFGRAWQDDGVCLRFCRELGALVVSVEYRRAPEAPFPAPLNDCWAGLQWLREQPGVDLDRVAVAGPSAGGGLTAALALKARDEGVPLCGQLLVYPMLDDRTTLRRELDGKHRLADNRGCRFAWWSYLGERPGADDVPYLAAAARAEDLSGLPPTWVGVGAHDLFHDEDLEYARRLIAAGVPCEIEIVPGAFHGFDAIARRAPVSKRFLDAQVAAMTKFLTHVAA